MHYPELTDTQQATSNGRYQLGQKWGFKKYNQPNKQHLPVRKRNMCSRSRSRSQSNLRDEYEDKLMESPNAPVVPSRGIESLRPLLCELFTNQWWDEKSLRDLKSAKPSNVSSCLRLCFQWCQEQIRIDDARFPAPYGRGTDDEVGIPVDNEYGCEVQIFIYLLHRYIGSQALAEPGSWDVLARHTVKTCPIKMLCTMSSLVVVVANSATKAASDQSLEQLWPTAPPTPSQDDFDDLFDVARRGMDAVDRHDWGDAKLVAEFCDEFQSIIVHYADYGNAVRFAAREYMKLNGPAQGVREDSGHKEGALAEPCLVGIEDPVFHIDDMDMTGSDERGIVAYENYPFWTT
ncbi:hypothetical protein F4808DRAFT_314797 [Astrocystis sublimbata]|nr:hypothetical protein F4808DRAFT_314797 [Astrocystis sublimbata]